LGGPVPRSGAARVQQRPRSTVDHARVRCQRSSAEDQPVVPPSMSAFVNRFPLAAEAPWADTTTNEATVRTTAKPTERNVSLFLAYIVLLPSFQSGRAWAGADGAVLVDQAPPRRWLDVMNMAPTREAPRALAPGGKRGTVYVLADAEQVRCACRRRVRPSGPVWIAGYPQNPRACRPSDCWPAVLAWQPSTSSPLWRWNSPG
jgi:hypothetical protein